jgi:adenylate cyclase
VLLITLFGTPYVESSGEPVTGRAAQGRRLALLTVLVLARGRALTRDKLIALLWPESPADRARHQLSDTLYILRAAVGEELIRSTGDELVLHADGIATDVWNLERLLDEGRLEEAVQLFTGPLLDGFHLPDAGEFEHWLDAERARLGHRYATALEKLANDAERRGDFSAALGWWRRLAAYDPYSGRIALRLMRALDAAGDRAGALRHGRAHAALLQEEFDAKPDTDVQAFAERLRLEPPARAAVEPAATLPAPAAQRESDPASAAATPVRRRWSARMYAAPAIALLLLLVFVVVRSRAAAPPRPRSVAVLPFVNMSADPENTYFSDGLSEQILTALSRIQGLRLAARTSSFAFRGTGLDARTIGDTLGVEAVLEGSVRREGTRLRVTAQLIDAANGYHIWKGEYNRELQDVFAVQEEIAHAIAVALEVRVTRRGKGERVQRAPSLAAYDLYLRALFLRSRLSADALQQATELLDRSIELEPEFAEAYAAKASVIAPRIYFGYMPREEGLRAMRPAVARALELDPQLGEAYAALGVLELFFEWNWEGANRALRRALELNPSDAHAWHMLANYMRVMGRTSEAVDARARGVELDPFNARTILLLATDYAAVGRLEEALTQYRRAFRLDPTNPLALGLGPGFPVSAAAVYLRQGRSREAVDEYIRIATLRGATAGELEAIRAAFARGGMPAFWGRWLEMDLRQSGSSPDPVRVANLWMAAGDTAQAFDWLERAYDERNPGLIYLRISAFRNLLSHTRMSRILAGLNFP